MIQLKISLNVFRNEKIKHKNAVNLLLLIMVASGIFGFVYETIFYRIDLGYFVKRGTTFGPWIPLYAYSGLFLTLVLYKYHKKPFMIFITSIIITGIIEYLTGYCLDKYMNVRLWDYSKEIWNFGNINGYVCFRSLFFFGLSSLFLMYIVIPLFIRLLNKMKNKTFTILAWGLFILFVSDIILWRILT